MPEFRTIADNVVIRYEGLFDFADLCKMIDDWQKQRGYEKREVKNFEQVHKNGRDIEIEVQPWKKINESERAMFKIIMLIKNMKDITINRDGVDTKLNQAQVQIKIAAFLVTDYTYKWEGKPYFHFITEVIDKWVYRLPLGKHEAMVSGELGNLTRNIRAYLNLIRK